MASEYVKQRLAEIAAANEAAAAKKPRWRTVKAPKTRGKAPAEPKVKDWPETCDPDATCCCDPFLIQESSKEMLAAWIYVATDQDRNSKVGMTKNLRNRSREHRGGNNRVVAGFLVHASSVREIESSIHGALRTQRLKSSREWFRIDPDYATQVAATICDGNRDTGIYACTVMDEMLRAAREAERLTNFQGPLRQAYRAAEKLWRQEFDKRFPDPEWPVLCGVEFNYTL